MVERIATSYALRELLNSEVSAFAIADKKLKVVSFSKSFKIFLGAKRIKGISFLKLLNLTSLINNLPENTNYYTSVITGQTRKIKIVPLKTGEKLEGYFVEIEPDKKTNKIKNAELTETVSNYQKEQQEILSLLLKENSLNNLASEILNRCTSLSGSSFGIAVIFTENNHSEFLFFDPLKKILNNDEIKKSINTNLSFINKWLHVNKNSLVVKNSPSNIGHNLLKDLEGNTAVVSPCFFEDKLLAIIIEVKKEGNYSQTDIGNIAQITTLLSFAISSVRTRELNAALESRLLQAQKLETIGKLSSGMAHDFSNLLSSIFGSLNLLKKKIPEREDIYRLLDNIENCSIRAKDLTKGLLSFGKPTPKRKELIKPNLLLTEISKVINQTFPQRISFINNVDVNLYDILGNSTEIYQVLLNLCVNAKEAIDERGELILKAKNITIKKENIANHPLLDEGNYVWFSVKDSGSGIDEENLQKIFDPYFSTKDKATGSGSGLGLYVTYGIIKAHKGHIEVSSVLGGGTTFDVFIPAYEPTKLAKHSAAGKIILLADDEIMLRDLLAELLESYGYNIIKVSSGIEALKVLTEEIQVDMAIIDYNMPEMDGLECIAKIRELKFEIPIILSSGSLTLLSENDIPKEGINAVITKPYEFDTMLYTIQKLI